MKDHRHPSVERFNRVDDANDVSAALVEDGAGCRFVGSTPPAAGFRVTGDLVAAVRRRTDEVVDALGHLDRDGLRAPSSLPGWSRLTIACHLDGGAVTSEPADPGTPADPVVEAPARDLLALLLGRSCRSEPRYGGDVAVARAFSRAFPGP